MKWLFTFAVVSKPIQDRLASSLGVESIDRAFGDDAPSVVEAVEREIHEALAAPPCRSLAYFRAIMDGWNCTHHWLAPWFAAHSQELDSTWNTFLDSNYLYVPPLSPLFSDKILELVAEEAIKRTRREENPGDYAASAFLLALNDGLTFANITGCPLVVVGRIVGDTMCDTEYCGVSGAN